jgi:hypothetical protein
MMATEANNNTSHGSFERHFFMSLQQQHNNSTMRAS